MSGFGRRGAAREGEGEERHGDGKAGPRYAGRRQDSREDLLQSPQFDQRRRERSTGRFSGEDKTDVDNLRKYEAEKLRRQAISAAPTPQISLFDIGKPPVKTREQKEKERYRREQQLVDYPEMWQDKEIRFDIDARMLRLIPGEFTVDRIENVEDTKGNNGDRGIFRISNLRLIWHAANMPRINLSIGLNTIHGITAKKANSKIKGETESMYVTAKAPQTRFEFVFTALAAGNSTTRLFSTTASIHRAYETTRLYRELKMRGPIVDEEGQLRILPGEQQIDRIDGVWNLSAEQGNLGVMIVTSIRILWYASMSVGYNVSLPYLQVAGLKIRDSRFGNALVIDTSPQSGEYVLGFRIDPEERLRATLKSLQSLQKSALIKPFYGISVRRERIPSPSEKKEKPRESDTHSDDEDAEIISKGNRVDAFAAYFSEGGAQGSESRGPVYSEELGLSVEELRPGFTIQQLWDVHVD